MDPMVVHRRSRTGHKKNHTVKQFVCLLDSGPGLSFRVLPQQLSWHRAALFGSVSTTATSSVAILVTMEVAKRPRRAEPLVENLLPLAPQTSQEVSRWDLRQEAHKFDNVPAHLPTNTRSHEQSVPNLGDSFGSLCVFVAGGSG
jgi:hypothetical protein